MFAIIATGGKQYRVKEGDILEVEKLDPAALGKAGNVAFDEVLMVGEGENVTIGTPKVENASVTAKVLEEEVKGDKVVAFKYKPKKRYSRKVGHRQKYTRVQIEKIQAKQ